MPSAEDHERQIAVRALYRIPAVPTRRRAIEFTVGRPPYVLQATWPGERAVACFLGDSKELTSLALSGVDSDCEVFTTELGAEIPLARGSFDLAILHRTLDDLRAHATRFGPRFDAGKFLARIVPLLAERGVLAGCVRNRYALKGHTAGAQVDGRAPSGRDEHDNRGWLSVPACRSLLSRAGLSDIDLYGLYPDDYRPVTLRHLDADAFAWTSDRSVRERQVTLGHRGYLARRLYAAAGLSRFLPPVIFFSASKR